MEVRVGVRVRVRVGVRVRVRVSNPNLSLLADQGRDQPPDRGDEAGRVQEDDVLRGGGVVVLAHGGPRRHHLEEGARDLPQRGVGGH